MSNYRALIAELILRERFPLFRDSHKVEGRIITPALFWVVYRTADAPHQGTMHFDLNIEGETCYLLSIELLPEDRCKGHGSLLYSLIEDIARGYGCKRLIQTPSGTTPRGESRAAYLERRGYKLSQEGFATIATKELGEAPNP